MNRQEKVKALIKELMSMAISIRDDWSSFDGRDLLKAVDLWCAKLARIHAIEYGSYYGNDPKVYPTQQERLRNKFDIDVSNWFKDQT